jgi:hypothetical protein
MACIQLVVHRQLVVQLLQLDTLNFKMAAAHGREELRNGGMEEWGSGRVEKGRRG